MASSHPLPRARLACLALALSACASAPAGWRFPLRDPVWRDTDLSPVYVTCRGAPTKKDVHHVTCAPDPDNPTFLWDGADNLLFRIAAESTGVVTSDEALDVNSLDEVPDSAWFTNRIGMHPMTANEIALGACAPADILDGRTAAPGSWVVSHGKTSGSTDGFRVKIAGKGEYMLKADDADAPERNSAAQVIGARALHAAGYFTTCEQVVLFPRSALKLLPGLHWKHELGEERPFDERALEKVLAHSPKQGDLVRMVASKWLSGYTLGGFRFQGTRKDDPNDVIPHEARRELRGERLLTAWLGRYDIRAGNTVDEWRADGPGAPDSSPGHVVHNQMDTSEIIGSGYGVPQIDVRLGHSYVVDWGDFAADFFTLGLRHDAWEDSHVVPGHEFFAYFDVENFDPEAWKSEYSNAALSRMTERDAAWMARVLARFTPPVVDLLAESGALTDAAKTAYLKQVLEGRLAKILQRYLTRLSPITDVRVEGGDTVCATDLAEWRALRSPERFSYAARVLGGPELSVQRGAQGRICVRLPHVASDAGAPDDAPARYVRVRVVDGVAQGPLVAHLYDLGPSRGYKLVGLERPEDSR
jgi:hypothetical protein